MKINSLVALFLVACLGVFGFGCGKSGQQSGDVNTIDGAIPVVADNAQVKELNSQLEHIEDQASAEKAVNTFVDYVDSRLEKGAQAQSLKTLINKDVVAEIARQEVLLRKGEEVKVQAAGSEEGEESIEIVKAPINIALVTDQLNGLSQDQGLRVNDEIVTKAKVAVEASIPNLNPQKNQDFSPLGAMVVGYALASNDDGTAKENSVKLPTDKISQFVENVVN